MYCIISGILLRVWVGGQEVDKVAPPNGYSSVVMKYICIKSFPTVSEESFEFP